MVCAAVDCVVIFVEGFTVKAPETALVALPQLPVTMA